MAALSLAAVGAGLAVFAAMSFLGSSPSTVAFSAPAGRPVNLTFQTVGTIGFGPHPTWVSYLVRSPSGTWVHSTLWALPADTTVHVTALQYDSVTSLRNPLFSTVTGVTGAMFNGQPFSVLNLANGGGAGHTFSVPDLGINVPLPGVSATAQNTCSAAPCTLAEAHTTVTFTFRTSGPGWYRWQCFIPCGTGFFYGTGGPMQTLGYMDGFLEVS